MYLLDLTKILGRFPTTRKTAIGPGGFEPPLPVPKTGVLPLDHGPT